MNDSGDCGVRGAHRPIRERASMRGHRRPAAWPLGVLALALALAGSAQGAPPQTEDSMRREREKAAQHQVEGAPAALRSPLATFESYYAALCTGDLGAYHRLAEDLEVIYIDADKESHPLDPGQLPGSELRGQPQDRAIIVFLATEGESGDCFSISFIYTYTEGRGDRPGAERAECHELVLQKTPSGWKLANITYTDRLQTPGQMAEERRRADGRRIEEAAPRFASPLATFEEYLSAVREGDPERELACLTDTVLIDRYSLTEASILPEDYDRLRRNFAKRASQDLILFEFRYKDLTPRPKITFSYATLEHYIDPLNNPYDEPDDELSWLSYNLEATFIQTRAGWKIAELEGFPTYINPYAGLE